MKKIYSLLFFCFTLNIAAQLSEVNHAPAAGNNYDLYDCDPTNVTPGASGAAVQWTFAGTTTTVAPVAYVTMTVNNPKFPQAEVGVAATGGTNSSYYSSDPGNLFYYGGNIPIPNAAAEFIYSKPAIKAVYPMSLNTTSSAVIEGSVNVTAPTPLSGTFTGMSTTICDGTGTLTVAGHSTPNIYRVVTSQTINFVASVSGTVMQTTYDYYEPDTKAPLFTISNATLIAFLQTNTLVSVSRLKSYDGTSITEFEKNAPMRLYPNPAVSEVKVVSPEKDYKLTIFDVTGKLVSSVNLESGLNRMNVSGFIKGLYVYKIEDKEGAVITTGKLTIIQ